MKRNKILILILMLFTVSISYGFGKSKKATSKEILKSIKKLNKSAVSIEKKTYDDKGSEIYDGDGNIIGYYLLSSPYSDNIKGFKGDVPLVIVTNKEYQIEGIKLLPNRETPVFVNKIKKFGLLKKWNGINVENANNYNIDAVSGATYTSRAIIKGVKARVSALGLNVAENINNTGGQNI